MPMENAILFFEIDNSEGTIAIPVINVELMQTASISSGLITNP